MAAKNEIKFLTYKGKPLVRSGNMIYYGDMSEPYVVTLTIQSTKTFKDMEIADTVLVQLVNTDPTCKPKERIAKKAERKGLYSAMDIGCIWLQRELEKTGE